MHEIVSEAGDVREALEVFGVHRIPQGTHFSLNILPHFPVVEAHQPFGVPQGAAGSVDFGREHAVHLLDASFMKALFLHHSVEQRDVEGHNGYHRAGPGNQGFVHRNECFAADAFEFGVQFAGTAFEMLLGGADGARTVNGVGYFGADVGVGDGFRALGEEIRIQEGIRPEHPVFAAHHFHGVEFILAFGGLNGGFTHDALEEVHGFGPVGGADGLEHRFVGDAGFRVFPHGGGHGVNQKIDLAEHVPGTAEYGAAGFVGEGVGDDALGGDSRCAGGLIEVLVVVPADAGGFAMGGFSFE